MATKSSAVVFPRIPPEVAGLQINFCKNPACKNFGVPAQQRTGRKTSATAQRDTYQRDKRGTLVFLRCGLCGEHLPVKSKLLAHTLAMTTYSLRDAEQQNALTGVEYRLEAMMNGCPVEDRFAARFNAGELSDMPPYFPGDRTALLCHVELSKE